MDIESSLPHNLFYRSATPENNPVNPQSGCFCCLVENEPLIDLKTCKHALLFQEYYKTNPSTHLYVCLLCHRMLVKVQLFQNQVRESCMVLKKRLSQTSKTINNLEVTKIVTFTYPDDLVETDVKIEIDEEPNENPPFEFVTDVKIEHDSDSSEFENDLPLSELSVVPPSEVKKTVEPLEPTPKKNLKRKRHVKIKPVKEKIVKQVKEKKVNEKIAKPVKEKIAKPMKEKIAKPMKEKAEKPVKEQAEKPKKLTDRYEGKVILYKLTRLELEEERERESQKDAYLKLPFKCESCVKGFDHETTLKSHNEKQHSEKKNGYKCDVCQTILRYSSFKEHTKRHYRRYQCVACGRRSQDIHSLAQHYNLQHDPGAITQQFKCAECDFITDSNRAYRYHRDKHKQKKQCTECGNTFVSTSSLRIHMLHVHKHSSREYKCPLCDKQYSSKSGLHSHHAAAHARTAAYCRPCHTHFRSPTGLAHHLRTHSAHVTTVKEQQKYICNECGVTYLKKATLREHIDWHHLKKVQFECPICSKIFKSSPALRSHKRFVHEKHMKPRDKICHFCGRGFTTAAILRYHIRTHTGERPLSCEHCGATFAHSAALYTHCKLKHKPRTLKHQKTENTT